MIDITQLQTGLPPIRHLADGGVNVVLAVWKLKNYECGTNKYISRWHVVNTVYYNAHPDEYQGWIELEDLLT